MYTDVSGAFGKCCDEFSWNHRTTTPHQSETDGIADSSTKSGRRNLSRMATVRIGWNHVRWFCWSLLLSSKRPWPRGGWENSPWETIRRNVQRTYHSLWSDGRVPSDFNKRSIQTSPIWEDSFYLEYALDMHWLRWEFGHVVFWLLIWKNWSNGRIRYLAATSQWKRSTDLTEVRRFSMAKLSGRDCEFRETTLRRERTVSREDSYGELQGDSGEPQPK